MANLTDSFQLQATDITDVTATVTYTWQNTGTTANVNQATVKNAGAAVLTISDADGTQVYSQDLAANGTFQTSAGTAGSWTIRVVLTEFSGTVNFRSYSHGGIGEMADRYRLSARCRDGWVHR